MRKSVWKIGIGLMAFVCLLLSACGEYPDEYKTELNIEKQGEVPVEIPASTEEPTRGYWTVIPAEIQKQMAGISMPEGASVTYDDLAYLTIPHINYLGERAEGHLVVDRTLAEEVLDIFDELYQLKFPIEKMELIDHYLPYIDGTFDNLDRASMGQNNTSAFYYRVVNGTKTISNHAYGRAIDINPKINPYCIPAEGYVSPANAYPYADRTKNFPGAIRHGDAVYTAFVSRGWEWGGDWEGEKDYQHFQKLPEQ